MLGAGGGPGVDGGAGASAGAASDGARAPVAGGSRFFVASFKFGNPGHQKQFAAGGRWLEAEVSSASRYLEYHGLPLVFLIFAKRGYF